ncbi:hypothetical protein FB451DRAFT_1313518 [Mycena latifolia]|nr:hypothetical protein FB451DRAFT_1313518 [Mycena latifolia]
MCTSMYMCGFACWDWTRSKPASLGVCISSYNLAGPQPFRSDGYPPPRAPLNSLLRSASIGLQAANSPSSVHSHRFGRSCDSSEDRDGVLGLQRPWTFTPLAAGEQAKRSRPASKQIDARLAFFHINHGGTNLFHRTRDLHSVDWSCTHSTRFPPSNPKIPSSHDSATLSQWRARCRPQIAARTTLVLTTSKPPKRRNFASSQGRRAL